MKSRYEKLEKKLSYKPENAWKDYSKTQVFNFAEDYKDFLFKAKTEREATAEIKKLAKKHGFEVFKHNSPLVAGKKYYFEEYNKIIGLVVIGKEPLVKGANILVSHIDSPRLDLKQQPLYEDTELAFFKTHYYGGIKKWHWVNHPLALHGVISTKDKDVEVNIGEKSSEPVFTVADILPHLGKKQSKKQMSKGVAGEELNLLVGGLPINDKKIKEKVKLYLLNLLHKEYGITEEDFISAELCAVPVGKPRDIGFDQSLIGAYGHDDKSCAYAELKSIFSLRKPERTCIAFFMDKEEIGSTGPSGSRSLFFEHVVSQISVEPKIVLRNSRCVSADVSAGVNPGFKDVHDLKNSHYINYGVAIDKYGGSGGKYITNDANAEFVGFIRKLLNKNKIPWQVGELGKIDEGGGGTIAMYIASYGCETIDAGVPLLSMHSPFEILSKVDLYALYQFYKVFLESK
jgi:aspartyl aminopeptidase